MTAAAGRGNLPAEIDRFIGRGDVISVLREHLGRVDGPRLITVTGPTGVGKSRLALHVARRYRDDYRHGVWIARLGDLKSPDMLAHAVAEALQIVDNTRDTGLARLIEALRDRQLLLILDNCEHLLPAVQQMVRNLVQGCEQIRILATSQEKLGLMGEQVVTLEPLSTAAPETGIGGFGNADTPEEDSHEAAQLFRDRARAVGEELSGQDSPLINELCSLLDGLPLALELAAVQLDKLTLPDLLEQLASPDASARFALLVDGDPTGQPSHQALLRAISLSANRCTPAELALWARLSVFPGDFDRDAAEQVCAGGEVVAGDILRLLGSLVRKSILTKQQSATSHRTRYRMLQTIRSFGMRVLAENDDAERMRAAHAEHFRKQAALAARDWFSEREEQWLLYLREEWPHFREATAYFRSRPDQTEAAQVMAVDLTSTRFGCFGGILAQNLTLLEQVVAAAGDTASAVLVGALCQNAWIAIMQGRSDIAEPLLRQARAMTEQLGYEQDHGALGYAQGTFLFLIERDAARARESVATLLDALKLSRHGEHPGITHMIHLFAALAACFVGRKEDADRLSAEVLTSAQQQNAPWSIAWGKWARALYELTHGGDLREAWRLVQEALRVEWEMGDKWGLAWSLWLMSLIAARLGQHELAALLSGGSAAQQEVSRVILAGLRVMFGLQQRCLKPSRQVLGDDYAVAEALGKAMPVEKVVEAGLAELPACTWAVKRDGPGRPVIPGGLSKREFEVAGLLAEGLTSKQIAERLTDVAQTTIYRHIYNAKLKLGLPNRLALITWYREQPVEELSG